MQPMSADGGRSSGPHKGWSCLPSRARAPDAFTLWGHHGTPTRHWGEHWKCSLLHLLHFCCLLVHSCTVTFTLMQFPRLVARQKMGTSPGFRRLNAFFFFLNLHVLHIEERPRKSHGRCHTVPLLFFSFFFSPPVGCCFFLCKPTGVFYFGRWVRLHLTSRISDIFTQFFTNLYTNGFKSWHGNFEQNSTRRLFNFTPFQFSPPVHFSGSWWFS